MNFLNPTEHPVGTKLLIRTVTQEQGYSAPYAGVYPKHRTIQGPIVQATVAEWSPSRKFVQLQINLNHSWHQLNDYEVCEMML